MEIMVLPPQEDPKRLTASSRSKTLGEHMQAFLAHYAHSSVEDAEGVEEGLTEVPIRTAEGILQLLVELHSLDDITQRDLTKYKRKLVSRFPEHVTSNGAKKIVYSSFGCEKKGDFQAAVKKLEDRYSVIDKTKLMNVYQSLFFNMVKRGVIKKPADVKIPELMPYAAPEFIAALQYRIRDDEAQKRLTKQQRSTRLRVLENMVLENPHVEIPEEDRNMISQFGLSNNGEKISRRSKQFEKWAAEKGIEPSNYAYNWVFLSIRRKAYEKKAADAATSRAPHILRSLARLELILPWFEAHPSPAGPDVRVETKVEE